MYKVMQSKLKQSGEKYQWHLIFDFPLRLMTVIVGTYGFYIGILMKPGDQITYISTVLANQFPSQQVMALGN